MDGLREMAGIKEAEKDHWEAKEHKAILRLELGAQLISLGLAIGADRSDTRRCIAQRLTSTSNSSRRKEEDFNAHRECSR